MAYANGYYIEWKNAHRDEMIQASIASFQHGDYSKFLACIQANIRAAKEETGHEQNFAAEDFKPKRTRKEKKTPPKP